MKQQDGWWGFAIELVPADHLTYMERLLLDSWVVVVVVVPNFEIYARLQGSGERWCLGRTRHCTGNCVGT